MFFKLIPSFFAFLATQTASPIPLKPLNEILEEETSPVMILYTTQRCAGLFFIAVERMKKNPDTPTELIQSYVKLTEDFLAISSLLLIQQRELSVEEAGAETTQASFKISELYDAEMEKNYLATGSSFSLNHQSDIQTCTAVYEPLIESLSD